MADEVSDSYLCGHLGVRGTLARYGAWTALGLVGMTLGLYRLFRLERPDPCLGLFFVVWGCLCLILVCFKFQRTAIWFELTSDSLRYRRAGRATILELPISEIHVLEPLVRPRHSKPYGFAILGYGRRKIYIEYEGSGYAMRLERALEARLNDDGPKPAGNVGEAKENAT